MSINCSGRALISFDEMIQLLMITCFSLFVSGVYRRTPKDTHPIQPSQSASNNSKQPQATGTDTGRSSSARVPKK